MHISFLSKTIIMCGVLLVIFGILLAVFEKVPGMGRLPGDIYIKREHFSFYFPLTTCILLSLMLSLLIKVFFKR